jgi:hypothetical protein
VEDEGADAHILTVNPAPKYVTIGTFIDIEIQPFSESFHRHHENYGNGELMSAR